MADETPNKCRALAQVKWTVETLHDHLIRLLQVAETLELERLARIDQRINDMEKAVAAALASADKALSKAEDANTKRFDSVNEFRNVLADQSKTMMTRGESETRFSALMERIETVNSASNDRTDTHYSRNEARIARLEQFENEQRGIMSQRQGNSNITMWLISLLCSVIVGVAMVVSTLLLRQHN